MKKILLQNDQMVILDLLKRGGFLLLFLMVFNVNLLSAQTSMKVTGVINDSKNMPLAGATVAEKGTTNGVISNLNGSYEITVSNPKSTLLFSFVGMKPMEVNVNGKTNINVVLEDDAIAIPEMVVTALGIKRDAKALGYAVSNVSGDDLNVGRETNLMSALAGKVSGVDISTTSGGPSGSTRVLIRGNSQLSGSNIPLYVVDGVPMDNTQLGEAGAWGGYDYGDGLAAINPEDIESVSVLKGPSASALYGSRASNGVVLITTKSGKTQKDLGIEFSSNLSLVSVLSKFDDYQRVYGQGLNGQIPMNDFDSRNSTWSAWGAKLDPNMQIRIYNGEMKPYANVEDNILSFFRTGSTLTNSVAMSGGRDNTNFRVSVSDLRNNDIIPKSDMSRTTFMVRGNTKLGKKITVESRVNYTTENVNNRPALSDSPNNLGIVLLGLPPNFDQKWLGENYKDKYGRYIDWNNNKYRANPYWSMNEMRNKSRKDRVMGYIQVDYAMTSWLNLRMKGGTDFYNFKMTDFISLHSPSSPTGSMKEENVHVSENNYEALLQFNKRYGKFDITAFIGGNIRRNQSKTTTNNGTDQVMPDMESILNYKNNTLSSSNPRKQVNSLYGAVNLGYGDYAYLDFSLRNDISSSLHKDNRSYTYPSVSGSFVFSSFFNLNNTPISFGKVRASWAKVGGDTDPYQLSMNYDLKNFTFHGSSLGQVSLDYIPNRYLRPTFTNSYEFGLDIRFFNNRLGLDLGYYNQTTKDQIMRLPISRTSGYSYASINAGEITNKGIEIALNAIPIQTKNFEWTSVLNMSKSRNDVVSLHPDVQDYELAAARWANTFIYASEGEPYGQIVGRAFARDPQGNVIYKNGLPTYDNEMKVLGNGTYDFILGFNNSFRYKNFNLGILLDMKFGADIYSMSSFLAHYNGISQNTLDGREGWNNSEEQRLSANKTAQDWTPTGGYVGKGVKNIGTEDNPNYVPNDVFVNPQTYWRSVGENTAEPFIFDASYVKLKEIYLTYSFGSKLLQKTLIRGLSVSVYARNLFTLYSNVKNIDPESNYNSGNGQGFEYGSLPSRRNFGFGINLKF